jgi:hypothetical protein
MSLRFDYECQNEDCGFLFEVEQRVTANRLRKCPMCAKRSLERVLLDAPIGFVKDRVETLGQLGENNSKAMGEQGVKRLMAQRERQQEFAQKSRMDNLRAKMPAGAELLGVGNTDKPWYGKMEKTMEKKINIDASGKAAHKYIMEGK